MSLSCFHPCRLWPLLLSTLLPTTVFAAAPDQIGADIYLQGRLPSGKPVQSTTQGDIPLTGNQVSCVSCHKRSGLGTSESRFQVPPITAEVLFKRTEIGRSEDTMRKFNAQDNNFIMGSHRPVYTEENLRRAITTGIDPEGRQLDPLMPRYKLNDSELDHLIAYMQTLSSEISPGVTDAAIHFATIIAGEVDKGLEKTMLDTMHRYLELKNANTRNETGRADRGPWYKEPQYSAYRKWDLHVWRLSGPADTWAEQLATYYKQQPVFAVLSGLGTDEWMPIHQFCTSNQLPCLFPNVNFAGATDTDFYTTYFFDGAELEARSIANFITGKNTARIDKPLIQVHYTHGDGPLAAQALTQSLSKKGIQVVSIPLDKTAKLDTAYWNEMANKYAGAIFVLWLKSDDLQQINTIENAAKQVFLSSSFTQYALKKLPKITRENVYLTYPFDLPAKQTMGKTLVWARLKKVSYTDKAVLGNTYFTLTMVTDVMRGMQNNLYRDYFMERVEHMADRMTTKSVYPSVSLAPGQRFVSKGCYIVRFDPKSKDGFTPVSGWITP